MLRYPFALFNEWNQYGRRTAERSLRWLDLQANPPDANELQMAPTPAETIYRLNKIRLLHYWSGRPSSISPPLLLVPSIINRYYVMDLQPDRSMVAYLLERGCDVWMVDWGKPGAEDRFDTFDDYVLLYLRRLIGRVRRETGADRISLLGYCIGGTFAAIYTALFPGEIANLINLAGPIDFGEGGIFCTWTRTGRFRPEAITGAFGNMPGWLMNSAFEGMLPGNQMRQAISLWERLDDEKRLNDFQGLRYWLADEVDFPGAAYNQYIGDCYQENRLVRGEMVIGGRPVDLTAISCPVLSISAGGDEIAPGAAVHALNQAVSSGDKEALHVEGGHISIVTGRDARQKLWPELADWLLSRSG